MINTKPAQMWLDEQGLDAVMLSTPDARKEYETERLFAQVSKALRHARTELQLSQTEVAALAGIDQRALSRLETAQGVRSATMSAIVKTARALHLRIDIALNKEGD